MDDRRKLIQVLVASPRGLALAITRALESGGEFSCDVWSDAGAEWLSILRAVASGRPPPEAPVVECWLRDHDVLNEVGDFAVPMMRRWVVENCSRSDSA
jgi:hypothetical protein